MFNATCQRNRDRRDHWTKKGRKTNDWSAMMIWKAFGFGSPWNRNIPRGWFQRNCKISWIFVWGFSMFPCFLFSKIHNRRSKASKEGSNQSRKEGRKQGCKQASNQGKRQGRKEGSNWKSKQANREGSKASTLQGYINTTTTTTTTLPLLPSLLLLLLLLVLLLLLLLPLLILLLLF